MGNPSRIGPLFTDLYELTMGASYFHHQVTAPATFSLFVRDYPKNRNYYVAAGLEDALKELADLQFIPDEIEYLGHLGLFSASFLSYLSELSFSGEIYALPEGTIFFADEPILEVTAPIIEAQIVETFLINTLGLQTMIASKASRCLTAAQGRPLVDFSLRRTQGQDAGMEVARAAYLVGFAATSNVLAGKQFDIPLSGTMAHSFVTAFENEHAAFSAYAQTFPDTSIFLIDTYDTIEGARNAIDVAQQMKKQGHSLVGVRLDSGDMAYLSQEVRKLFDAAGLQNVKIIASSGFDEEKIADVLAQGGRIDAFGVGTRMGVSADAPYLDIIYKMVHFSDRDVRKLSTGKTTLAGKKQVFRRKDSSGHFIEDILGVRDEQIADTEPLLDKVMSGGKIITHLPSLEEIRTRFQSNFASLEEQYTSLADPIPYPVTISSRLHQIQETAVSR